MSDIFFVQCGTRRRGEKHNCEFCGKEFIRRLNGKKKCCSIECSAKSKQKRVKIVCSACGTEIERTKSRLKRSKHGVYFCSSKCKISAQSLTSTCPDSKKFLPAHYGTGKHSYASICKRIKEFKCIGCGETKEYLLTVHHIDGDRNNNPIDGSNWEVVCQNCHIKRHLKKEKGKWVCSTKKLTPRNILKLL